MSKCKKSKNPCKICLQPVTAKTGIHCQGACNTWVHYSCLNYTPGRISDIKKGIIKVTCPCPDCITVSPKEFRTDEPFTCTNRQCPANLPPKCELKACPINSPGAPMYCKRNQMSMPNQMLLKGQGQSSPSSGDDYRGNQGNTQTLQAVEQMCNTVGQLTKQINELMQKMKQVVTATSSNSSSGNRIGGGGAGCTKTVCPHKRPRSPKSPSPNSCTCTDNPRKK